MSDGEGTGPAPGVLFAACAHLERAVNWLETEEPFEFIRYELSWIGLCDDCSGKVRPLGHGEVALELAITCCDRVMSLTLSAGVN